MEELRERQARMVEELRTLRADLEAEAGKGARMRAGIQAKAHELARDGQQLARLRAKHRSLMDEGEANVEWERSLSAATAAAEEALAARGELRAQGVVKARQLHNEYLTLKGNIRVFCRVRPPLPSEGEALARLDVREDAGLTVHGESQKSCTGLSEHSAAYDFAFDHVFGPEASQADVFEEIALLVQSALDGYRVAVFAYGQTGGGKTHTMDGPPPEQRTADTAGVIPRTVDLIFSEVEEMRQKGWDFEVYASSMEVYNENVLDMLAPRGSAHLPGAPEQGAAHAAAGPEQFQARRVESASAVHALLRRSARERHTAATACNDRSSRSHAIFQLSIVGRNQSGSCPQEARGLLSLVDLAGSERVERSGATGDRLREAQHINRSLSALGDVIEALARRGQAGGRGEGCHVPYRNSRLTTLLKDSLGGNSKALMFVNVSPCARHLGETLSSLRFAAKVHGCNVGVARRQAAEGPRAMSLPGIGGSEASPAHLRPPAGRALVAKSVSTGALVTAAGLPASVILKSSAEQARRHLEVPEGSECGVVRVLASYRGFMPGVKSETVFGTTAARANAHSGELRAPPSGEPRPAPAEAYEWTVPLDRVQGVRSQQDCEIWAFTQQEQPQLPAWMGGERREHGPAVPGYGGHSALRRSRRPGQQPAGAMPAGARLELDCRMPTDRDCQPWDVHRPVMPGYAGFIRRRHAG
ncbi:unnamed protein product [Prorocentrum cordatum]|uniref:Kinesin motor domain-containing protein n=1 Tax=Prorocentrum cordatum TaxID=2364126 RepID=A0ABN9U4W8_9DINO|nr:unnamed protein product [Polarella glacialis]